jgi:hypothetical protein
MPCPWLTVAINKMSLKSIPDRTQDSRRMLTDSLSRLRGRAGVGAL